MQQQRKHAGRDSEAGYMLLAVVVMTALVLIALSVAAPVVARDLRRDKEVESEHRANEYVRAIQLYYRKTKAYPPSIKALENTNNVRFLRKQYIDPLTGEANWRLIHLGEQKTTVKGFFGQPLGGLPGSAGGLGSAAGMQSGMPGMPSSTVNAGGLSAGFNGATIGGTSGTSGTSGISGATAGPAGSSAASTPGATGTGAAGSSRSGTSTNGAGMFGDSAGGGQIVGVGTARTGSSILTPNAQDTYETWEFWYDPRIEILKSRVSLFGGVSSGSATGLGGTTPNSGAAGAAGTPGAAGTSTTPSGTTTSPPPGSMPSSGAGRSNP